MQVGEFPANDWGLKGMHGNVWEWCQVHWHHNYEGAPIDRSAWLENDGRILRSGSCDDYHRFCRSAFRMGPLEHNIVIIGFRIKCDIQDKTELD